MLDDSTLDGCNPLVADSYADLIVATDHETGENSDTCRPAMTTGDLSLFLVDP